MLGRLITALIEVAHRANVTTSLPKVVIHA